MSQLNPNGPIVPPDLRAVLNAHRAEVFAALNCCQIGKIVSFTPNPCAATVQLVAKRVVYNQAQEGGQLQQTPTIYDYPLLTDVPVHFPGGSGGALFFPLAKGDAVIVLFNDRDMDTWFETNESAAPNSPRLHSLSDGMAIPCLFSKGNPIPGESVGANFLLMFGGAVIKITPAGAISITGPLGNNLTVLADGTVQLTSIGQFNITALDVNKVHINNGILSLKTALDDLMTVLAGWINTGGSTPNPATVAALAVVKTEIDSLLA